MNADDDKTTNDNSSSQPISAIEATAGVLQALHDVIKGGAARLERFFESEEGKELILRFRATVEFLQKAEARLEEQDRISSAIANARQEHLVADAEAREKLASAMERLGRHLGESEDDSHHPNEDNTP